MNATITKTKNKPTGKSVAISARISQEDATFLAQYKAPGAVTPSEKLRGLIEDTRKRQKRMKDFRGNIGMFHELLQPVMAEIREQELQQHVHSELVTRIFEWLPDMMAFTVAAESQLRQHRDNEHLIEFEQGIADRIFRLIQSVMQMGVTKQCACYNKQALSTRFEPILDLAQVIKR